MRESTYEFHKMKDKAASDRARQERMAKPNQYNRHERYLADFRANQLANAEHQRKMELQKLQNLGQTDVANITGLAGTEQQRLRNVGMKDVAGMEQAGQTKRLGMQADIAKQQNLFNQYKDLRSLEQNINAPTGYSYIPGWQEYQTNLMNTTERATSKYTPITRSNGTIDYFDQSGNLAYSDKPKQTTPNVPGSTLPSYGGQSPLTRSSNENQTQTRKETFESIYGTNPTLKDIWTENERRKKQKDAERKKLWTVPY